MSRHRNVRSMNYSDEYDGYDDVYGHSVEDDYCISPSEAAFMYDREGSRNQQKIGAFLQTVKDIAEEDEGGEAEQMVQVLSDTDRAKLEASMEQVKAALGPSDLSKNELANIIISHNFDTERALNYILDDPKLHQKKPMEKKEKDVKTKFVIPKLNGLKTNLNSKSDDAQEAVCTKKFFVPKLTKLNSDQMVSFSKLKSNETSPTNANYTSLADLTRNHLKSANVPLINKIKVNTNVNDLPSNFATLKIDENKPYNSKSLTVIEKSHKNIDNNWHIDLSKALRTVNSAPLLTNKTTPKKVEKFTPKFIECNPEPISKKLSHLEIKNVFISKSKFKAPSKFGKILSMRYKNRRFKMIKQTFYFCDTKQFSFNTPSPDDVVSGYLEVNK